MSALNSVPATLNFLSPLSFKFMIYRAPTVNYFLTKVNIPGISISNAIQNTPFVNIPQPGLKGEYNDLDITFKIDEDLNNYFELHLWMLQLGDVKAFNGYQQLEQFPEYTGLGLKSEILLSILDHSKNPVYDIIFHDAFPIELNDIEFRADVSDIDFVSSSARFKYTTYSFIKTNPIEEVELGIAQ